MATDVADSRLHLVDSNNSTQIMPPFSTNLQLAPPSPALVSSLSRSYRPICTPAAGDFAIGRFWSAWLCEDAQNTLVGVFPNGTVRTIAKKINSATIAGPTAGELWRGRWHRHVLHVSTNGLSLSSTGEVLASNGKIVSLDTRICG